MDEHHGMCPIFSLRLLLPDHGLVVSICRFFFDVVMARCPRFILDDEVQQMSQIFF